MLPVLFTIAGFEVHTYGVAAGLGLFLGILGAVWLGTRDGLPSTRLWDVGLVLIAGGVLGARLEYVRTHWDHFAADPARVLAFRDGGLVFYGGFVLAVLGLMVYTWARGLGVLRTLDVFAPMVPFGHAIGRLGCFAAGCCFGAPTDVPWAVVFPPGSEAPAGVPLHPTQLYEAGYSLVVAVVLAWLLPRRRFDGQVFGLLLVVVPALRAVNEVFRGDAVRGFTVLGLSNAQATSILLGTVGVAILVLARGRVRRAPA